MKQGEIIKESTVEEISKNELYNPTLFPLEKYEAEVNKNRMKDIVIAIRSLSEKGEMIPIEWIDELEGRISNA